MCGIRKIKNSNVAGVNLSGIGIFVNQSIENKNDDAQTTTSAKVYAIGVVRGWTMFWVILSSLLSIAAIIFCIAALYRKIEDDNPGYDYLGVIIGVLALFITFLVAWQIYNTIDANRKISSIRNDLISHNHYVDARIHFTQGQNIMQTTLTHISQQKSNKNATDLNPAFVGNLCVAYRNFLEAITHYLQSNRDIVSINACIENMESCLNSLEKENVKFTESITDKCNTLFDTLLLMQLLTSPKLEERLISLNKRRTRN